MLQSKSFIPTISNPPRDEVSRNAQLLVQAGYIRKLMAGVYTFLPLGWRVMKKIEYHIRQAMDGAGAAELFMPALHPVEHYQLTRRDSIDVLFHLDIASGKKAVLGQSHEEVIVPLVKDYITSYKDLPLALYQIQTKFRNEKRAKSGIMRGREFMMKDLYSFHADESDFESYYSRMQQIYSQLFAKLGLGEDTYMTYASGGTFSQFSHEYQTITQAGEDMIHVCPHCRIAVNEEIRSTQQNCPQCHNKALEKNKAIEVGNIFPLKSKFSDAFGLSYVDASGKKQPIIMGCYGIGLGRVMGTIAELYNDKNGLCWPKSIAPFQAHILDISKKNHGTAQTLYQACLKNSIDVLYDDRAASPGMKLKDADLIGIPIRLVISDKTEDKIEYKWRQEMQPQIMQLTSVIKKLIEYYRGTDK